MYLAGYVYLTSVASYYTGIHITTHKLLQKSYSSERP